MLKQQKAIDTLDTKLSGLTKGTDEYRQTAQQLHVAQKNFNADFGPAAKGLDSMKESWAGFKDATRDVTTGVMGKGFDLIASVLPKLVPVSNAAGRAVGGLIDDLSQWTEGPSFKHLPALPGDLRAEGHHGVRSHRSATCSAALVASSRTSSAPATTPRRPSSTSPRTSTSGGTARASPRTPRRS
jgi:hypothetical protein